MRLVPRSGQLRSANLLVTEIGDTQTACLDPSTLRVRNWLCPSGQGQIDLADCLEQVQDRCLEKRSTVTIRPSRPHRAAAALGGAEGSLDDQCQAMQPGHQGPEKKQFGPSIASEQISKARQRSCP